MEELSADEIAGNAGVSKRTLYKYFASKKEMYLGVVKYCFKEMSEVIQEQMEKLTGDDPYLRIECIGNCYLRYCLKSDAKCKAITSFNENDYRGEFPDQVNEITRYSNTFEISAYIKEFYRHYQMEPPIGINSLSIYLWAHVQGLTVLMMSKKSWIEDYYQIDFERMIQEHLKLGKTLLLGGRNENEV